MMILGVVLLILGFLIGSQILWILGIILVVVGAIFFLVGASHPVGGRRHWY